MRQTQRKSKREKINKIELQNDINKRLEQSITKHLNEECDVIQTAMIKATNLTITETEIKKHKKLV